jgi:uncharacterized protein (TIGR02646 family)
MLTRAMIRIEISIIPPFDSEKKRRAYARKTKKILDKIRQNLPNGLKSNDLKDYWVEFKYVIWDQQKRKCCFCEQKLHEPNSRIDHYRPKTRVVCERQGRIQYIIGYWWIAYEWKNFLVLCETCNRQKGDEFPLVMEDSRVHDEEILAEDGSLGNELPLLINPRFEAPESFFEYDDSKFYLTQEIYIKGKDSDIGDLNRGNHTKRVIDLNRIRVNEERYRDNLPWKRGKKYKEMIEDWDNLKFNQMGLEKLRTEVLPRINPSDVPNVEKQIKALESRVDEYKRKIIESIKDDAEFSGLCRWYSQQPGRYELIAN